VAGGRILPLIPKCNLLLKGKKWLRRPSRKKAGFFGYLPDWNVRLGKKKNRNNHKGGFGAGLTGRKCETPAKI
jgi:hypothetical protein